jgi:hypothetical protein
VWIFPSLRRQTCNRHHYLTHIIAIIINNHHQHPSASLQLQTCAAAALSFAIQNLTFWTKKTHSSLQQKRERESNANQYIKDGVWLLSLLLLLYIFYV